MSCTYAIYILTNARHTVLYVGVTNDLVRRMSEHRAGIGSGFTKKYKTEKLVYFELFNAPQFAIAREKQIKGGSRARKLALIQSMNPEWKDLAEEIAQ